MNLFTILMENPTFQLIGGSTGFILMYGIALVIDIRRYEDDDSKLPKTLLFFLLLTLSLFIFYREDWIYYVLNTSFTFTAVVSAIFLLRLNALIWYETDAKKTKYFIRAIIVGLACGISLLGTWGWRSQLKEEQIGQQLKECQKVNLAELKKAGVMNDFIENCEKITAPKK